MTTPQIVQFTYTNRLTEPADWSVTVGVLATTLSGQKLDADGPMSPAQAQSKYGLTLNNLVAGINGQAIADLATASQTIAGLNDQARISQTAIIDAQAQIEALQSAKITDGPE